MAKEPEQVQRSDLADVSDETLSLYLLSRLSDEDRSQLDERLLTDDSLADRVQLAESQLIDEYASGDLGPTTQKLFVEKFLTTEARRKAVRLSVALQNYANPEVQTPAITENAAPGWLESFKRLFSFKPNAAWAAAGSFAVLILLLGGAWWLTSRRPSREPVIATSSPVPTPHLDSSTPSLAAAPAPSPPKPEIGPSPEPASPVAIASAVLLPGALRAGGDMVRVAVPRGERDIVRLSLVLETSGSGPFQAVLTTAEGQTVTVRNRLASHRNGQTKVVLEVPARLIQTGDYQVKLSRKTDGQTEPIGRYYFRAVPE